ncbi:MAG: hypothetical protein ACUVXA_18925 [Candidatus Jordarchaeum sp.]|uniref:hypothetical protein n=1 Tax=Candidatus Jordarchaeum sp. TaxID=2823881 RepID=UPI00404A920B
MKFNRICAMLPLTLLFIGGEHHWQHLSETRLRGKEKERGGERLAVQPTYERGLIRTQQGSSLNPGGV